MFDEIRKEAEGSRWLIYDMEIKLRNVREALGYGLDERGFDSRWGLGVFLFTTASRTALGPAQPPIQWIPGGLSLVVKRPGREADHSSHLVSRSRMRGAIPPLSNTPSWHGA
jgi:hypothetical protein